MITQSSYKLGFSPCPNDTFIFDALVNKRLASSSIWQYELLDVEQLNRNADSGVFDVTKLSFSAFARYSDRYQILSAGSALGKNCGPLIISKRPMELNDLKNCKVAIPGVNTTANLLMSIFVPECRNKIEMVFSEIEEAVLSGKCDAGLIIHENRFTYKQKGLLKIADMGELWENDTGLPIPLGCIAVKRSMSKSEKNAISDAIKKSIQFAYDHPEDSRLFIGSNAQDMSPEIQQQHIDLYVNEFSIDLGKTGKKAILTLFNKGLELGLLPQIIEPVFIDE
jgi:1,4-dihydroxy-6-naphthoate synthase